jgi:hypothetical protein
VTQHEWNIWSVELGEKQSDIKHYYSIAETKEAEL